MGPKEWARHRIKALGVVQAGKAKNKRQADTDRPYLRVANVFDGYIDTSNVLTMPFSDSEFENYKLAHGDILLNEGQSLPLVGRCSMYRGEYGAPCAIQNALIRFRAGKTCRADFAEQLFRWLQVSGVFASIATQTTSIAHLGVSHFANLEVLLPPLGEQRKIAAILGSVDEAIERTQAVIDQVQVVKQALMQQLLTRGLPGRHTRFKQTEIGEIPESWEVRRLGDVAITGSGGTPKRSEPAYWGGSIPWVKTGEVDYRAISSTEEQITALALSKSSAQVLPVGTVLLAMYGQGKTRGRVGWLTVEAATNQACAWIQGRRGVSNRFLYHWLCSEYERIRRLGREGSQKNLNLALVRDLLLPVGSVGEQEMISMRLDEVGHRVSVERATLGALKALKQSLMSVLLTGELRVTP